MKHGLSTVLLTQVSDRLNTVGKKKQRDGFLTKPNSRVYQILIDISLNCITTFTQTIVEHILALNVPLTVSCTHVHIV